MSVHKDHRQRVKQKFLELGLKGFHDHEMLELLLFYAIPRKDVNPIAHALLQRFGSLSGVFEASVAELQQTEGIGESAAVLVHLCIELFRSYAIDRTQQSMGKLCLTSTQLIGDYLKPYFTGLCEELLMMACVDHKGSVLYCGELGRGSLDGVSVSVRTIVEIAMRHHAHGVILAHNHPHGIALPSQQDMTLTELIRKGLRTVEIQLLDHVIYADDDYVSFRESRLV